MNKKLYVITYKLNSKYLCSHEFFGTYDNAVNEWQSQTPKTFDDLITIITVLFSLRKQEGITHLSIRGKKEKNNRILTANGYTGFDSDFIIKEKIFDKQTFCITQEINEYKLSLKELQNRPLDFALEYLKETQSDKIKNFLNNLFIKEM